MADGGPPLAHCVSLIASVLSLLPELSGRSADADEVKLDAATENLLHVISSLTRFSRDTNAQLQKLREREEEASRLLAKFKKVARQQKDVIDTLEAFEADRKESPPPQAPPTPVVVSQSHTSSNTDLTQIELAKMQLEAGKQQRQAILLNERDAQLAALTKDFQKRDEECGRLRIMLRRAEGVIEAQRGLLDELEEAARKNRAGRSRVGTPSRGLPPSRTPSSSRDAATAPAVYDDDDDQEQRARRRQAPPSNGLFFPEIPESRYSEPPQPPFNYVEGVGHGKHLQQREEEEGRGEEEEEEGEECRDGLRGDEDRDEGEEWEDDDEDHDSDADEEDEEDEEGAPSQTSPLFSVSLELTHDGDEAEAGRGKVSALVRADASVDDSFSLIQQYYDGQ